MSKEITKLQEGRKYIKRNSVLDNVGGTADPINRNYYHYLIHNQSTSNNKTKDNLSVLEDILRGYEKAIELLENDMRIMPETIDYLKCFYVYHASILYEIASKYHMEDKLSYFRSRINMYYSAYFSQNKADMGRIEHIRSIMEETNG